ncbi:MAG TPA: hypothetical protein VMU83_10490 [Hanamia sp.]|nr:hypothetical protein [Hanamia sp.]
MPSHRQCVNVGDNSEGKHELLAQKTIDGTVTVIIDSKFDALKYYYDNN